MAGIGLSKPYAAIYTDNGDGNVTYADGATIGKAIRLEMSLNGGNENVLYADNGAAESDNQFSGGTITIGTDDLLAEPMTTILGLTTEAITGTATTNANWLAFGDEQVIPYLGFGAIIKKQQSNETKWVAVVFPKIQFQNPGIVAETQGESISWQTPELTATLMRDDTAKHRWLYMSSVLNTEADAELVIKQKLGITTP